MPLFNIDKEDVQIRMEHRGQLIRIDATGWLDAADAAYVIQWLQAALRASQETGARP